MSLSDYQVSNVIRAYMRNMATRANQPNSGGTALPEMPEMPDDLVSLSHEGLKAMLFERIGEHMTDRLKRQEELAIADLNEEP